MSTLLKINVSAAHLNHPIRGLISPTANEKTVDADPSHDQCKCSESDTIRPRYNLTFVQPSLSNVVADPGAKKLLVSAAHPSARIRGLKQPHSTSHRTSW